MLGNMGVASIEAQANCTMSTIFKRSPLREEQLLPNPATEQTEEERKKEKKLIIHSLSLF